MAAVEGFIEAPSEELLAGFNKDQLLSLAGHYGVKRLKTESVRAGLVDAEILPPSVTAPPVGGGALAVCGSPMTFEQQKELLQLQLELARERRLSGRGLGDWEIP